MIIGNDRESLIEYRLNQAFETVDLAKFLVANDKLTALALRDNFQTSKHGQLIRWFNKKYVSTGKLDKKYGKILRNAH